MSFYSLLILQIHCNRLPKYPPISPLPQARSMAEGALFSLASKLLGVISSESFKSGYERGHSILEAEQDVDKLKQTIQTIQAVLLDAEVRQGDSAAIKDWIEMLRDVLYDADDLFDLVATEALLKQQMKETKFLKKVRTSISKLNPIISSNNIAKKVKAVRKRLDKLCNDMSHFQFGSSIPEKQSSALNQRQVTVSLVDKEGLIGRDDDKEAILKFLFDKSRPGQSIPIIAIVGNEYIGKTTLAQLVYSDEEVKKNFERRCWAAISDIHDYEEILARIFESVSGNKSYHGVTISKLFSAIRESIHSTGKYLLVLDGVMDCTSCKWLNVMSMLRSGTIGSRIIITATCKDVANAMGADLIHQLEGLPEEEAWKLFKMIAFQPGQRYTPHQEYLGREIVGRCNGVPLAIKSVASLLSTNATIEEWELFIDGKMLPFDGSFTSTLRLSYNQLPSTLKQCVAYCSLFPKHYVFRKEELIYLWIGQGFVMPMSDRRPVEEIGCEYFMELFQRLFFQEATVDECGEVLSWKMHGAIHDLVRSVAGDESIIITKQFNEQHTKVRHLSVGYEIDSSWNIPQSLFYTDRPPLRSFLFLYEGSVSPLVLDDLLSKFKHLRTLNLGHQNIEEVPSSIGELKHLRYLNLSNNRFMYLPDSTITLVNLLTLDISWCEHLELLPDGFRKLSNLRHLDTKKCYRLRYMPPGFEGLTSLQCLSFFKVGKVMDASNSKLNVLAKLELKGELEIRFDEDMYWDENECLQLPNGIRMLTLENYPGKKLPYWETAAPSLLPNLVSLHIGPSSKVEHLSLFRGLTSLQTLQLSYLEQLEYIETEEDEIEGGHSALIFPCLKVLKLEGLLKLKGWSREVEATVTTLPVLADLTVRCCPELKFMPLSPRLETLELNDVNQNLIQHLLSTSLDASSSSDPLSSLETIAIWGCDLPSFPGGNLTSLRQLQVRFCDELKYLNLAPPELNTLEELVIQSCPELVLWEEEKRGVDWDALPKLCKLTVIGMPDQDKLPGCLQQRQAQGNLLIKIK